VTQDVLGDQGVCANSDAASVDLVNAEVQLAFVSVDPRDALGDRSPHPGPAYL